MSLDMESVTWGDNGVALVKKFIYRKAKLKATASFISIITASSSLSTELDWTNLMFPGGREHGYKD